jgi:U3 small nucleolar RNA-associated protein 7
MAVWDIRMFREVNSYRTRAPVSSLAISDTGLTAAAWNTTTTIWKDLFSETKVRQPYMSWGGEGKKIDGVQWCPFEDVLGLGHDRGFSSILVPGAGEANFDALEVNPYENTRQRQETEVRALLGKIQPEMIALDPSFIGKLDQRSHQQREVEKDLDKPAVDVAEEIRNRARGRNSALKKYMRKQRKKNIVDDRRLRLEEAYKKHLQQKDERMKDADDELGPALSRFARKGD